MKPLALILCLSACAAVSAQTAPKASKSAKSPAAPAHKTSTATAGEFPLVYKVPADEHRSPVRQKRVAVLAYQDLKIGTGAEGESGKLWHVKYKGWRAADGVVFDSWENNRRPMRGEDGKPVMNPDGTAKMGDPEPLEFPQGIGARIIPGFDDGIAGMRIGGKRRLFIPWQMAYGVHAIPDRPDHPGIPAKSDLIFDVELVSVTDMPAPQARPMPPMRPQPGAPGQPGAHPTPPVEGKPVPPDASKPAAPSQPTQPGQPAQPQQPNPPQP